MKGEPFPAGLVWQADSEKPARARQAWLDRMPQQDRRPVRMLVRFFFAFGKGSPVNLPSRVCRLGRDASSDPSSTPTSTIEARRFTPGRHFERGVVAEWLRSGLQNRVR